MTDDLQPSSVQQAQPTPQVPSVTPIPIIGTYFYHSNYSKVIIVFFFIIFLYGVLSNIFILHRPTHIITIENGLLAILALVTGIIFYGKPVASIDANQITIFGSPFIYTLWKKLTIPLNSITRIEIKGNYMWFNKRILITYKDQNNKEKTQIVNLGFINNSSLFQQLLSTATAKNTPS